MPGRPRVCRAVPPSGGSAAARPVCSLAHSLTAAQQQQLGVPHGAGRGCRHPLQHYIPSPGRQRLPRARPPLPVTGGRRAAFSCSTAAFSPRAAGDGACRCRKTPRPLVLPSPSRRRRETGRDTADAPADPPAHGGTAGALFAEAPRGAERQRCPRPAAAPSRGPGGVRGGGRPRGAQRCRTELRVSCLRSRGSCRAVPASSAALVSPVCRLGAGVAPLPTATRCRPGLGRALGPALSSATRLAAG